MQENNTNPQPNPVSPAPEATTSAGPSPAAQGDFIKKVVEKIKSSENILIVLSRTPSIDGIAAALGLAMFLDSMQKHTTAVYSGRIPDSLAFLQPMETFETNTDSLQDFIISLDKDKADHLRYKLEGDAVKVFITPYKTIITEDDLNFSHGDYNVDFVIAINVPSSGQLDYALKDHSRVMRDASVVNITAGEPGRFGEIEWSNPVASSLCEMVTNLIFAIRGDDNDRELDHDIATTLLAGIVAATERFSNDHTNPDTLGIASKLMSMGADQQLITSNISSNEIIHNEENYSYGPQPEAERARDMRDNLTIDHEAPEAESVNPFANPALQMAPNLDLAAAPMPEAMVDGTNNVTPESVVVQPVIPGAGVVTSAPEAAPQPPSFDPSQMQIPGAPAPTPAPAAPVEAGQSANATAPDIPAESAGAASGAVPAPEAPATPTEPAAPVADTAPVADPGQMQIPNLPADTPAEAAPATDPSQMQIPGAPAPEPTHSLMADVPTEPTTRQTGNALTPPSHAKEAPKNYAEMMEAALSDQPAAAPAPLSTPAPTPEPATPEAASPTPAMEPVANDSANAPVLPPPPVPNTDDGSIMPPVLPPVQMPPQM